jgi:hypothetical protein
MSLIGVAGRDEGLLRAQPRSKVRHLAANVNTGADEPERGLLILVLA